MLRILSTLLYYISILFRPIANGSTWAIPAVRNRLMTLKKEIKKQKSTILVPKTGTVQHAYHVTFKCWGPTLICPGRDSIHIRIFTSLFVFARSHSLEGNSDAVDAAPEPGGATFCSHNMHTRQNLMQPY